MEEEMTRKFIVAWALCLAASLAAQQHSTTTTTHYPAHPISGIQPPPMMAMPSVGPLFINTETISSSIVLVNNASRNAGATVTLRDLDGSLVSQKHFVLHGNSQRLITTDSLVKEGSPRTRLGNITVLQDGDLEGAAVNSQILITNTSASVPSYIDEELFMPSMEGSVILRGVADPSDWLPLLAIHNSSEMAQSVRVKCIRANMSRASTVTVGSHATSLTPACSTTALSSLDDYVAEPQRGESEGVTGIELSGDGMPGSLSAFALVLHHHLGATTFSAASFIDPKTQKSSKTVYPGVPIGTQTVLSDGVYRPYVSLTNFSSSDAEVTIQIASSDVADSDTSSGSAATPAVQHQNVHLRANESKVVLLDDMKGKNGVRHSISITSDQQAGMVQSKVTSRSDGALYQVELPGKDSLDAENAGGHPWTIADGTAATLILHNFSQKPIRYDVRLVQNATVWHQSRTLSANDTRTLDIRHLIEDRVPDAKGNVLSPSVLTGVAYWSLSDPGAGTGRLLVSNPKTQLARNFSCGYTDVVCGMNLSVFNDGFFWMGNTGEYGDALGQICVTWGPGYCNGATNTGGSGGSAYWSLGNTSIVNFNSPSDQYSQYPFFKAVAPGKTTAWVTLSENGCSSSGSGAPPPYVPWFTIAYSSYIPVDHLQLIADGCSYNGINTDYIYMGDGGRGTARTYEGITMTPGNGGSATAYYAGCGQTRQYAYGSPKNGSTLSSLDEDNRSYDCYLWNAAATASSAGFTHSETYSTNQGQELFIGSAGNPLESLAGPITWNMRVLLNTTNVSAPTATVNYNHTCFPSHHVVVNGEEVYLWTPSSTSFAYIALCLGGYNKVIGQTSAIPVPVL